MTKRICVWAPRLARCGHEVPGHGGRQRVACPQCTPPPPVRPERSCPQCGSPVEPGLRRPGPLAIYCSSLCKDRASRGFSRADGRYARSLAERRAKYVHSPKTDRDCVECGQVFASWKAGMTLCSKRCQGRHRERTNGHCAEPGCDRCAFARGLCRMHLHRVYRAEGRDASGTTWNDRRRNNYHKRRARIDATTDHADPVVKADIAERDQWRCHICRKKIRPDRIWPHPYSATLDHVMPLSLGGTHVPENVRLAHLRCNTARGNRGGGEQLLLIG